MVSKVIVPDEFTHSLASLASAQYVAAIFNRLPILERTREAAWHYRTFAQCNPLYCTVCVAALDGDLTFTQKHQLFHSSLIRANAVLPMSC
jgi:hypothetical protein